MEFQRLILKAKMSSSLFTSFIHELWNLSDLAQSQLCLMPAVSSWENFCIPHFDFLKEIKNFSKKFLKEREITNSVSQGPCYN